MLRSNLAILLAERNLKITKVSEDTGISRTTLTALANNRSQGLQFDTLNTLCLYLGVEPAQIIAYAPIDLEVIKLDVYTTESPDLYSLELHISMKKIGKAKELVIFATAATSMADMASNASAVITVLNQVPQNKQTQQNYKNSDALLNVIKKMPPIFVSDFENLICENFIKIYREITDFTNNLVCILDWDNTNLN